MRNIAEIISSINTDNSSMNGTALMDADVSFEVQRLTEFEPSTWDEICDIMKSPSRFCEFDLYYPNIC